MTSIPAVHERYGGLLTVRGDRRVVAHYGRPDRTYDAIRNVAGVIEHGVGIVSVEGPSRRDAVEASLTNALPAEDSGTYGFVLGDGTITADAYVFDVGDRLLGFVPSDRVEAVAELWSGNGYTVEKTTREMTVFGVYGPKATEKIASVCSATTPETPLAIARGAIRDIGVTVIREDGLAGEEGYLVVTTSEDAEAVFDAMVNRGLNATPFGYETWERLTLEAGTPLFETELRDAEPAVVGVANAFPDDAAPEPSDRRLCGFTATEVPEADAAVYANDRHIGHVTRAVESPSDGTAIGFAVVETPFDDEWTIGDRVDATAAAAPFIDGSDRSARMPAFQ
ncbi:glycine cleavage T C-terminal barrel domain-containing protein [Halorhabdus rudnickae]|uniref:glycine cleavage T C-terminal barrel domain-containing protein n=1 Tax=Halorhabdus rudnickae TaxID=1775544 RepID=UPI001082E301|nr:glycine cleavage T C-terminal barrel domain-containing protein [Halorhabdus rudnickae]